MSLYVPLFRALNDAGVRYVVVGGFATVMHGYARMTADIDIFVSLKQAEIELALKTLLGLGLKSRLPVDPMQFTDAEIRRSWQKEKGMEVFSLYAPENPLLSVDLFVHEPIPYDELIQRSEIMDLGEISIPVCAIEDLIELKTRAARPKDIDDIEHLREIQRIRQEDDSNE